ncbi:hypothetical protein EON79_09495 [bacterium]|nr:MAG: hypothetical protein EON79_09495 [bacterium]
MTYEAALAYIASLQGRGWRLGLDRMEAFVDYLGLSDFVAGREGCRFLHIAGTNGKGSVTAFLQSILVEAGHRTGAFFSPYVVDPRERIQIGRYMIEKEELASIVAAASLPVVTVAFLFMGWVHGWALFYFALAAALLVIRRHRDNIKRLMAGTESRFGKPKTDATAETPSESDNTPH